MMRPASPVMRPPGPQAAAPAVLDDAFACVYEEVEAPPSLAGSKFELLDSNQDGVIDRAEWAQYLASQHGVWNPQCTCAELQLGWQTAEFKRVEAAWQGSIAEQRKLEASLAELQCVPAPLMPPLTPLLHASPPRPMPPLHALLAVLQWARDPWVGAAIARVSLRVARVAWVSLRVARVASYRTLVWEVGG